MFEQIGEGHKIMHEGQSKPELDLKELERQTVFLASRLSERSMHTVSTKTWLELAEQAAKEADNA